MKKALSFLIILTATLFSCKKSDNQQPEKLGDSYQPVTKGTYWKYTTASGTSVRTMTGETAVFKGKTYYKFTAEYNYKDASVAYYGQQNADYFIFSVEPVVGENEALHLKENAAVGDTWIQDVAAYNGIKVRNVGKIIEKNITHVVLGKTYNNVIHTQLLIQSSPSGSTVYSDAQTINYYIAKGIGIIDVNDSTGPSILKLTEYSIK
nr:hypothetical protein [uncultured Mucilaginibacter sp.]